MSLLRHPRLPEGEATHVLASGEFPWLAEALERRWLCFSRFSKAAG